MTKLSLTAILLLVVAISAITESKESLGRQANSLELVEAAYKSGSLSKGDKIYNNLLILFAPDNLPQQFQSDDPLVIKSGTPFIFEAIESWELMTPEQQETARVFFRRPPLDSLYVSPSGYFHIHYGFTWPDSVSDEDLDESGIPDYVEKIALYADSAHNYYQNSMGYFYPPADADGFYDIYLVSMAHDAYGRTMVEFAGPEPWNDYVTFMEINCDLSNITYINQDPEGAPIGAMKVTCAHEFFHATQCAYDTNEDIWWMECSAVAYEDVLFPEVKDNYQFAPLFFDRPDTSLTAGPYRCYGAFVWSTFLMSRFGDSVIKEIFEYTRDYTILGAIDSALKSDSSSMKKAFPEFAGWNYFTGERADPQYYPNGADYPAFPIDQVVPLCPFQGVTPVEAPDAFGCNYLVTYPDSEADAGLLRLQFDGDETAVWGLSYITFKDDESNLVPSVFVDTEGRSIAGIYDYQFFDSLVFIPAVVSPYFADHQYVFNTEINPFGDCDGTGERNLIDILVLIALVYEDGDPVYFDWRMGDLDCSGDINLVDILLLIDLVYAEGPEPLPCRY